MQLRPEQIAGQLEQALLPVWLISGDEPLQQQDCLDQIRAAARSAGFDDRQTFSLSDKFDWSALYHEAHSMGLFGGRKLLELRLGDKRPDKGGSEVLCQLLAEPDSDILWLISASKLDYRRDRGSKWVKAVDQAGAIIDIWPVDAEHLPHWIRQRCQSRQVQADDDAIALLAELSEGNLLACAQEIDKLALLFPAQPVSLEQLQQSVGDCSRHTLFDLGDALSTDAPRVLRVLDGVRAEGIEEIQILWALTREARQLEALASGQPVRLPPRKQASASQHARRLGLPAIGAALALAGRIDQTIKGMRPGDPASGNTALALRLAGAPLAPLFEQL